MVEIHHGSSSGNSTRALDRYCAFNSKDSPLPIDKNIESTITTVSWLITIQYFVLFSAPNARYHDVPATSGRYSAKTSTHNQSSFNPSASQILKRPALTTTEVLSPDSTKTHEQLFKKRMYD